MKFVKFFFENRLLEIGFLSKQCQNDLKGCCAMCDYGCTSDSKDNTLYLEIMEKILLKYDNTFDCLLLCTNGSFMDNFQINDELYNNIISKANKYRFQKLEIETHYNNVTLDKLDVLKAIVSDKEVIIEMGLETINEEIQKVLKRKVKNVSVIDRSLFARTKETLDNEDVSKAKDLFKKLYG